MYVCKTKLKHIIMISEKFKKGIIEIEKSIENLDKQWNNICNDPIFKVATKIKEE